MSFSRVYSAQIYLLRGQIIAVEADIFKNTLHAFTIVGLPDKAVEESKDRVSSAIKNSGFKPPKNQNQKIVVSLSPAEIKKEGPYFDLAIALAYLLSEDYIEFDPKNKIFLGALSLNGDVLPTNGILPLAQEAKQAGFSEIYVPKENAREAALIKGIKVFGVANLKEIISHLDEKTSENSKTKQIKIESEKEADIEREKTEFVFNFKDVRGQETAKRGLEIAAAGGHNVLMWGPPGTGKTMLARALPSILPDLGEEEILEVTGIHSVAGMLGGKLVTRPPFRSPHHTASYVSMVGGGTFPKPGEVTLAHRGVLFLDEFPEFEKRVMESLRQPLEDKVVNISRARGSAVFPSDFIMIAAMNPCPCGNLGSKKKECICTAADLVRYQRKISGPIADRVDIFVQVGNVDYDKLSEKESYADDSEKIKERVLVARKTQEKRFSTEGKKIKTNAQMGVKDLGTFAELSDSAQKILNESAEKMNLSARAYHRVIKLARTIADMEGSDDILDRHIMEAIQYRVRQ